MVLIPLALALATGVAHHQRRLIDTVSASLGMKPRGRGGGCSSGAGLSPAGTSIGTWLETQSGSTKRSWGTTWRPCAIAAGGRWKQQL